MVDLLNQPLELPCGRVLQNRIAKSGMSEGLADQYNNPTQKHANLYQRWSTSGASLVITGNVMVDRRYLEHPGNVVLENAAAVNQLTNWTRAGTRGGNELWLQLNHAGRQTPWAISKLPVAPSAVPLMAMGRQTGWPRPLKTKEIEDIVIRFAVAAKIGQEAGFTGVQIQAANGYLISQFLSPRVNKRKDEWGGSIENRARFLIEIVRAVRATVGADYPISVKINAADFQREGFTVLECHRVAELLVQERIDLLEISGGSYEAPVMVTGIDASAESHEAYFLQFAKQIRYGLNVPLMVSGGFRTRVIMNDALEDATLDMIGIGRPFCIEPGFPKALLPGALDRVPSPEKVISIGPGILGPSSFIKRIRELNHFATLAWCWMQMHRMGDNLDPDWTLSSWDCQKEYTEIEKELTRALVRK